MKQHLLAALVDITPTPSNAANVLYLGLLLTLLNVIDKFVVWFRGGQAPVLKRIDEVEQRQTTRIDKLERDVTDRVTENREHIDRTLDEFHGSVTGELNGWATRIKDNAEEIDRNAAAIETQARAFIQFQSQSTEDRRHINTRLAEVERKMDGVVSTQSATELRVTQALANAELRIMNAINAAIAQRHTNI